MTTITYKYNAIGWVRSGKGKGEVLRYKIKNVCNCITSFANGGGYKDPETGMANTAPHILIEYIFDDDDEDDNGESEDSSDGETEGS